MNENYIQGLRQIIGHQPLILVFAGGILRNTDGPILLQQRSDSQLWGFPGGMLQYGESTRHAVIREIQEETGLLTKVTRLLGTTSDFIAHYPNGDVAQTVGIIFEMQLVSGQLNADNDETSSLRWFSLKDHPQLFNNQAKMIWKHLQQSDIPFYD
ncbi:NUDIX hydrolase [Furfurilactobacillus rossiae]|uniref:NUDIX hydrolase n=1 Tax=Furfurilactobacillus rossiae DSM 15814 TaxID=1114972 RepID=A0A0R1RA64_9LACO|nr:NUDIX domain-containing protein [Furfurilactobacillus rossiae]KRL53782.1 NUDIX hydrolase [Furfurilactobacillus rossiae DSM 15814]MCF6164631.1 NUDIX domain-containing protein [Furfurilactobacillus rossiae]QFR66723.1 NUDIX domain-containing protein [Furfurilactobacillus rossiae]QLE62200.1 MutT-nudix protein [Furfurilactobacillus rossiae]QLE64918.1 MutT-nudix family protein [Furfurilactobacillus rossiae]